MSSAKKMAAGVAALILLLVFLAGGSPGAGPAPQEGKVLEELHYRVDFWVLKDSLPATVSFKRLESGHYRGEIIGETQGMLGLLSRNWQGSFSSEMALKDGKLMPLVYREESRRAGRRWLNEYRFDYEKKKVELFKLDPKKGMVKKWETPLKGPMFDGISFYYNQRLGLMSLGKEGEVQKFPGIPYPKPEEITLRVGAPAPEGRKVMVTMDSPVQAKERSEVFALLDGDGVPTQVWTSVLKYGKITGTLLPGGKRLKAEEFKAQGERIGGSAMVRR